MSSSAFKLLQGGSNLETIVFIHIEQFDGPAADGGQTHDPNPIELEMCLPGVEARVKYGHLLIGLRIVGG